MGKKDFVLCLRMEVREGLRMSASRERNGGIEEFDQYTNEIDRKPQA